jgi:hypothetical protein
LRNDQAAKLLINMPGETHSLIASDKVEGTAVYRSNGDQVGTIERDRQAERAPLRSCCATIWMRTTAIEF